MPEKKGPPWRGSVYREYEGSGYIASCQIDTGGRSVMIRGDSPLEALQALHDYIEKRVPFSVPRTELTEHGGVELWVDVLHR